MALAAPPNPLPPNRNIGPMLAVVSYVFVIPAIITTIIRLWMRTRERVLGIDDCTITVAALLSIVLSAVSIVGVHRGKGHHVWYLTPEQVLKISELSWINQVVLFCELCLIKISICLLVLRIKNTRGLRYFLWGVMALLVVTNLIPIIALCIECKPTSGFWDRKHGKCRPPDFRIYSIWLQASYSVLTDLLCSTLPIVIVWNLQLALKKKVGVCLLMCMGLIATAFAAVRASSLSTNTADTTFDYTYTGTWMVIEANLGIIASNLAPMRGFVYLFKRRIRTYSETRSRHGMRGNGQRLNIGRFHESHLYGRRSHHELSDLGTRASDGGSDRSQLPLKEILQTRTYEVTNERYPKQGKDLYELRE